MLPAPEKSSEDQPIWRSPFGSLLFQSILLRSCWRGDGWFHVYIFPPKTHFPTLWRHSLRYSYRLGPQLLRYMASYSIVRHQRNGIRNGIKIGIGRVLRGLYSGHCFGGSRASVEAAGIGILRRTRDRDIYVVLYRRCSLDYVSIHSEVWEPLFE